MRSVRPEEESDLRREGRGEVVVRAGPVGFEGLAHGMRSELVRMRPREASERASRRFSVHRSAEMSTFPTDTR
jgi:hypothetical protein